MRHGAIILLGCLLSFSAGQAAAAAEAPQEPRATMGEIFAALAQVLPASLDERRFADPDRREETLAALTRLAAAGAKLEEHGRTRDAGFGFLARSLARDTEEIRRRYAEGRNDEARFLLHEVTQDCVACHSRLPSQQDASLGRRLMSEERVAALPLDERARLEFATRQFERAQETSEALLASLDYDAMDLVLTGALDEYLELCLRVRRDFERAARTLAGFALREDVSEWLRARIGRWVTSLGEIAARKPAATPLLEAEALLAVAQDRARFPDAADALVYDLAASGALHRFIDATPPGPDVARAFFELGQIEARIGRSFWLSQTEIYLETSIRLAPGEAVAPRALAQLRDFLMASYTGSAGQQVPADVQLRLAELELLVAQARAPAADAAAPVDQVAPPAPR